MCQDISSRLELFLVNEGNYKILLLSIPTVMTEKVSDYSFRWARAAV